MRRSTAALALLICPSLIGCVSLNQGPRPMGTISGQMTTTPELGEWCRVTLPEVRHGAFSRSQSAFTGQVVKIDGDEITLSEVVKESRSIHSAPGLRRVPYIRRMFRNTGVGVEAVADQTITLAEFQRLEIITKDDARRSASHLMARELVAAVIPGPL